MDTFSRNGGIKCSENSLEMFKMIFQGKFYIRLQLKLPLMPVGFLVELKFSAHMFVTLISNFFSAVTSVYMCIRVSHSAHTSSIVSGSDICHFCHHICYRNCLSNRLAKLAYKTKPSTKQFKFSDQTRLNIWVRTRLAMLKF